MPSTSTALIFLPTISRSRSRRTTSTSGSSGISFSESVPPVGVGAVRLALQPIPRNSCGRLLGRLLRASLAAAVDLVAQEHRGEEAFRMVGSFVAHLVPGELVHALGGELLQAGLVVLTPGTGCLFADARLQGVEHQSPRRFDAAVE